MFHKENTSLSGKSSNTKKNKDAPLRKSDKRKLRDSFLSTFFSSSLTEQTEQPQLLLLAEDLFGKENILQRKLKVPNVGIVLSYLRTPSSFEEEEEEDGEEEVENMTKWPYQSTQPILLSMETNSSFSSSTTTTTTKTILVPSIPLLALFPTLLPIVTVPCAVSKYLCRGADLMKSGILSFPSSSSSSSVTEVVSICVKNNPQPFAVGFVTQGTTAENVGAGQKGVAVKIVCCFGDDWWRQHYAKGGIGGGGGRRSVFGGRYEDGGYGNVGFVEGKMVLGLKNIHDDHHYDSADGEEEEDKDKEVTNGVDSLNISSQNNNNEGKKEEQTEDDEINNKHKNDSDQNETKPKHEPEQQQQSKESESTQAEEKSEESSSSSEEEEEIDMDKILLQSFHRSLLLLSPSTDLPLPISTYYSKFLLPSRPPNTALEMKQTSYKKIGVFLLQQESDYNIITLKPSADGKDRVAFLVAVDKNHVRLREAKLQRRREEEQQSTSNKDSSSSNKKKKKMAIVTLYQIPPQITSLLQLNTDDVKAMNAKSEARRGTGFLTMAECRDILNNYITTTPSSSVSAKSLIDEYDPEFVVLNGPLTDALYKPTKKQLLSSSSSSSLQDKTTTTTTTYPTSTSRKELLEKWIDKMEKGYAIVQMPGNVILEMKRGSNPPMVILEVECRQNRKKFVTRVRGLEEYNINPNTFANDISKRLACSSTIETTAAPGRPALKKNHVEIVFQGHLVEEIKALLLGDERLSSHGGVIKKGGCEQYCLPKGCIEVVLRKGVPAKRRK